MLADFRRLVTVRYCTLEAEFGTESESYDDYSERDRPKDGLRKNDAFMMDPGLVSLQVF